MACQDREGLMLLDTRWRVCGRQATAMFSQVPAAAAAAVCTCQLSSHNVVLCSSFAADTAGAQGAPLTVGGLCYGRVACGTQT
jgi:hypothetical protein